MADAVSAATRALVPFHKDLRLAGLLPPVDAPHHMRVMEWKPWREGVVLRSDPRTGSFVDVGLYDTVRTSWSTASAEGVDEAAQSEAHAVCSARCRLCLETSHLLAASTGDMRCGSRL